MKRVIALILITTILCIPVYAKETTLYTPDGRTITIVSDDADQWRAQGWCDREQVFDIVYSPDGQSLEVLTSKLAEWRRQGWSDDISQVQTVLYADDGRAQAFWNAQVEAQLTVGWYRTPEEAQTVLYADDGRSQAFWNAQVEAQLTVGWYRTPEEVQTVVYSSDGQEMTVWNAEVADYLSKGWSLTPPGKGVDPNKPMVALTFDDGPGPYTDRILNCLEKYGARATFFVVGNRLSSYSKQLQREADLGMEIGNHSWSHTSLTTLGASGVASEISRTSNKIHELVGIYPATVRPPYGSHNASVRAAAGAPFILWSIDTLDWKTRNATSTYNSVMNNVKDGDIILMHDIHSPTADAVERIVPALVERGFQLVTVSEMGAARRGGLEAGASYSSMRP